MMKTLTAKEFRQATDLDPEWATKLTEPVMIEGFCDMLGSKITRLSRFLTFSGQDPDTRAVADFSDCTELNLVEGEFIGQYYIPKGAVFLGVEETPIQLHNAIWAACSNRNLPAIEILLEEKKAFERIAINQQGDAWKEAVVHGGELLDLFIQKATLPKNQYSKVMETAIKLGNRTTLEKILDLCKKEKFDLNMPLCYAATDGNIHAIKRLVEEGANVHYQLELPLRMAGGHKQKAAVDTLVQLGADLDKALTADGPKAQLLLELKARRAMTQPTIEI